jgi:hypothetical protein
MTDALKKKLREKQIIYVKFIPRLFTAMLDFYLLALILLYPMAYISKKIYIYMFRESILKNNIDLNNNAAIGKLLSSQDFMISMSMFKAFIILGLIQFFIISFYFIFFWHKFSTTPIKFIFGMKIVDSVTLSNLSIKSCIKRMFGLLLSPIGIWYIIFTKERQALHDKIAGSIVIKR